MYSFKCQLSLFIVLFLVFLHRIHAEIIILSNDTTINHTSLPRRIPSHDLFEQTSRLKNVTGVLVNVRFVPDSGCTIDRTVGVKMCETRCHT
jgi:hypothetical protein